MSAINQEDFKQRQDDELISITAIFPNEVTDLRQNKAWKNWKPLELQISLTPNSNTCDTEEITTKADLLIKCPEDYPCALPYIDIQNTKGLSIQDVVNLKEELNAVAKNNIGNEMLFDFINCTQNFLREHKKPHYASFYHEMMHNHSQQQKKMAEEEEKEREAQKLVEEEKQLAINTVMEQKREAWKLANQKVKIPDSTPKSDSVRPRSHSESSCKDICTGTVRTTLKFDGKKVFKDYSVFCGKCMNHNKRGCVIYYGMDTTSGDPVVIIKWTLQWQISAKPKADELETIKADQEQYIKQLQSLDNEFKSLRQLKHKNLALYLGMSYVQKREKITVFILQEYVSGCPLSLLSSNVPLSIHQVQSYIHYVLEAIQYLHEKNVIHKNIRDTSIFVTSSGDIKLSDYCLDKKLYDMYRNLTKEPEIDIYPPTIGKAGRKCDIYRLGVVLLTLCTGQTLGNDTSPKIPQTLNPWLKDFIDKCLLSEHERWSAKDLLSHSFMALSSAPSLIQPRFEDQNVEKIDSVASLPSSLQSSHSSRLSEFEVLECLGKGGFGHVFKVKNLLDSRIYALKKIFLSATSKHLDKKMKREVKVLSRLNHENIVRYFNSWIEESLENEDQPDSGTTEDATNRDQQSATSPLVRWGMNDNENMSSSEEEDEDAEYDDIEEGSSILFQESEYNESSGGIAFESNIECANNQQLWSNKNSTIVDSKKMKSSIKRFMYIQMEYCEKSTLRYAIDHGLHEDVPRVWRLFREIVEGLVHIHQQNVIHRDLKPVNIFLDSNEHVKIGDFGLATDVISKSIAFDYPMSPDQSLDLGQNSLEYPEDALRTGNVGTTLYVAPEVSSAKEKLGYSQKVDIYSLGIIFFEMCYPPTVTLSERYKLIMNLRKPDIIIPTDKPLLPEMVNILNWLLQHDVNKRPNSSELSVSKYIPPPHIEETELHNILRNTVENSQTRSYKYMMSCLFSQKMPSEFDFTYDTDVYKGTLARSRPTRVFCDVVEVLNRILKMHGAVSYSVPTLMPKSSIYSNDTCVYVLDHGGSVFNLPHDLRVPFARHIARKEIIQLKRFTLEKVYRQEKVIGFQPREHYEYAFDIVTPSRYSLMPDAEVLSIISEIINEFSSLDDRGYCIYLNHFSVLNAIMKNCDITKEEESIIYDILDNRRNRNASKIQLHRLLNEAKLPEEKISKFTHYVDMNENLEKITNMLQPLCQRKGEIGTMMKKGLDDLASVVKLAEAFGVKLPIIISPCLVHEVKVYSSIVFLVACDVKTKKKKGSVILAAGGRYDNLISSFKLKSLPTNKSHHQTAVGASIEIEKIVAAEFDFREHGDVDFVVYSNFEARDQTTLLLKDIWALGYSVSTSYDKAMTLNDVVDYCQSNKIANLLIINKNEKGVVKVRSFDKEKIIEKKLNYLEFIDQLKCGNFKTSETSQPVKAEIQRSLSLGASVPAINVRFLSQEKIHSNRKREPNIRSHVMSILQPTLNRNWEILVLDLKMTIVGSIVSVCSVNKSDEALHHELSVIAETHSKFKKYLLQVSDEICDIKSKKNFIVVLYSLPDSDFKVIL